MTPSIAAFGTALRRLTASLTAGGLLLLGVPALVAQAEHAATAPMQDTSRAAHPVVDAGLALAAAHTRHHRRSHPWRGHPDRRIRHYTAHRGDTATGLAVRFHAWTDELLRLNHLTMRSRLHVGQHLRIPVVVSAARRARRQAARHRPSGHHSTRHAAPHRAHKQQHSHQHRAAQHRTAHSHWRGIHATRAEVRRLVARTARRHGLEPQLALAIAWHESGWQQHRVSSAGALGVMQVMPATGRWLSSLEGRRLHLRRLRDNVLAGVLLLKMLRAQVGTRRTMAAYYQGLGSVQAYGLYADTRLYVASVAAVRTRLRHGWDPA